MDDRSSDIHPPGGLGELLERHRPALQRFLEREGSGLLRHESAEDLVQGVHLRALQAAAHFTWQGDPPFLGWLFTIARQHVAHRHEHWSALKRDAGTLLRISTGGGDSGGIPSGIDPAGSSTGPVTFVARREMLRLAMRATELLSPRDLEIVRLRAQDLPIEAIAQRLGVSYDAAQRAQHRALERFRKALEALRAAGRSER